MCFLLFFLEQVVAFSEFHGVGGNVFLFSSECMFRFDRLSAGESLE